MYVYNHNVLLLIFQSERFYAGDTGLCFGLVHQPWPVLRGCFLTLMLKVTTLGSLTLFNSVCYDCVSISVVSSHSKRLTQVNSSAGGFNGSRDTLDGSSLVDRHPPTAPPQAMPPAGAFVGESQLPRADRYITG